MSTSTLLFTTFVGNGSDLAYWLARCQGFRVESPTGRLGTVVGLRWESRVDRPDRLVIRTRFRHEREIAIESVERIDPNGRVVYVKTGERSP
jgi:hypothetical protein